MTNKPGKKDSRSKTPPEKRKSKGLEPSPPPAPSELTDSSTSSLLKADEIQALAIRPGDLEKLHPRRQPTEEQRAPVTNRILIRKHQDKEEGRKRRLLVARPAPQHPACAGQTYPDEIPVSGANAQLQPHNILGSLQELRKEAAARGNLQVAHLIPDAVHAPFPNLGACEENGGLEHKEISRHHHKQDNALLNWQHHMDLRKRQLDSLSRRLCKPSEQLVMNTCEDFRRVQEERRAIDRCIPALEDGKGHRVGSEFWNLPERIGDELSGLVLTLTRAERGYPSPVAHIGKPAGIKLETGLAKRPPYHDTWDKSLYLQHRRHKLKSIMEELDFAQPDIDGLEIIGRGRPFTSVSAKHFPLTDEDYEETPAEEKETPDSLEDFPDAGPNIVLGPSLLFCGQPANWVEESVSHRDKVGISTRITFEALAGEKASSALEVANNGSTAIWYEWRRLPNSSSLAEHRKEPRVQHFYFNTSAGVILPGETLTFPFHFKSPTAGIFGENWEFCTHPVLLAGALIQVSLWGIALYEDKTAAMREALQRELESREAMFIAQKIVQEIMENVRSPERPPSPATRVTEEEMFRLINPELHYKHQPVQELKQLWREYITPEGHHGAADHLTLGLLEQTQSLAEEESAHEWNLSVADLKQASNVIHEEEQREVFLHHVNRLVGELTTPAQEVPVDLMHQACLQLWREAIDKLVARATELCFVLGMPDKDVTAEMTAEENAADQKPGKAGRDERRTEGIKEDKRTPVGREKEERKGGKPSGRDKLDKEERPGSRRVRGKDEKKAGKPAAISRESKELVSSGESLDFTPPQSRLCQVDPVIQEKYRQSLYSEVYDVLASLAENLVDVAEDLKSSKAEDENVAGLDSLIIPQ
ncbi:MYCBP-associated protein [Gastrophryne carolinensis]